MILFNHLRKFENVQEQWPLEFPLQSRDVDSHRENTQQQDRLGQTHVTISSSNTQDIHTERSNDIFLHTDKNYRLPLVNFTYSWYLSGREDSQDNLQNS